MQDDVLRPALLLLGLSFVVVASGCVSLQDGLPGSYRVEKVVDGDTVEVSRSGKSFKVRLLGVDTPEVYREVDPREFGVTDASCLDRVADNASMYVENRLQGENVTLEYGRLQPRKDRYGRTLAWVYHGDENLAIELVKRGLGRFYSEGRYTPEMQGRLKQAQRAAKNDNLGYWQCG